MQKLSLTFLASIAVLSCVFAEDRWVWASQNDRRKIGLISSKYEENAYRRNAREREPTTRRPQPGQPQNDEIDDYTDGDEQTSTNIGTRNYPYPPNGYNSGQVFGGNGVLVGPGGPTGIIGRPQQFPGAYPSNGFGQPGLGFPGGFGGGNSLPGAYGGAGQGQFGGGGFAVAEAGLNAGGFSGGLPNGSGGQYPVGAQYPGIGAQIPVGPAQFPANGQYPLGPGQFQGGFGAQYPGGQFQGGGGPQYTEGYGLAYTNQGFPGGFGGFPGASPYGYATGFRDYDDTKRKLQATEKSAAGNGNDIGVESRNLVDQRVDDKINKNLKKVPI